MPKENAYSSTPSTSDTSFRRTWDRTEYAAKAATREAADRESSKAHYEAKLAGRKYHAPPPSHDKDSKSASLPESKVKKHDDDHDDKSFAQETSSRAQRLDVSSLIGKTTLVPAGSALGKRGRGAGFYCGDCDLTFKDNVQFVDHLNSRQHLVATGQSGEVRRAGVEEVRERLRVLAERRRVALEEERREREGLGLGVEGVRARVEEVVRREEVEREERRRVRREKRRKTAGGLGVKEEDVVGGGIIC